MKKKKALSVTAISLAFFWCLLQLCLVTVSSETAGDSSSVTEGRGIPNFVKYEVEKGNDLLPDNAKLSLENSGFWILVLVPSLLCFVAGYVWASSDRRREPDGAGQPDNPPVKL